MLIKFKFVSKQGLFFITEINCQIVIMRVGIDLSANNTYIEFSFEKSLRKYQKNPHKKVKCNLSNLKEKQTCSHCLQKLNKINSLAYSQRASILQQSRSRYHKKSRDKAREYSQQKNSQNMISADRSRIKLNTHIQQKALKEISNFNISQHKQLSHEKEQFFNQFEYILSQNQQNQSVKQKRQQNTILKENYSPKKAFDISQQDESFSNIQLSQVKSKVNNTLQFNFIPGPQQLKTYQSDLITTKQYLKDEEVINQKKHKDNPSSQKIQVQNENFQQQEYYESVVQPSYFCFSQSSEENIQEDFKHTPMLCEQNHSINNMQTPIKIIAASQPQKQVKQEFRKQKLSHDKIQRLQLQSKKQLKEESKKQYRQRVIFKLQKVNNLQNNCMQCQRYSLQIKNTIKVQLQKMDQQFHPHLQNHVAESTDMNQQKITFCQQVSNENVIKELKYQESQAFMQQQQQKNQIIQEEIQHQVQNKLKTQTIKISKDFSQCKIQLKRERRERQKYYNEEQLWNFGRLKLNKQDNKQILCLSMRSLNRFIQKNWTVEQITSQLISRRPYLQENFVQICQMVKNYLSSYKRK